MNLADYLSKNFILTTFDKISDLSLSKGIFESSLYFRSELNLESSRINDISMFDHVQYSGRKNPEIGMVSQRYNKYGKIRIYKIPQNIITVLIEFNNSFNTKIAYPGPWLIFVYTKVPRIGMTTTIRGKGYRIAELQYNKMFIEILDSDDLLVYTKTLKVPNILILENVNDENSRLTVKLFKDGKLYKYKVKINDNDHILKPFNISYLMLKDLKRL